MGDRKYRGVSLFSGAGGLDVGFEAAGFEIVFASEFDPHAAETWRANRPDGAFAMVEGDINEHLDELKPFAGTVDVLFGGPPCQGFSIAGKMNPMDERSQLVWTYLEAVEIVKPKVFVMENVKALAQLGKWSGVRAKFVERAQQLGYNVSYKVHHVADYGVPQNRERVVFVGVRNGESTRFESGLETHKCPAVTAREAILSAGAYGSETNPQTCTANVSLAKHPVMRKSPYAGMLVNGAGRPINLDALPPTLPASMGGNKTPIVDQDALENPGRQNWFVHYHDEVAAGNIIPASVPVPRSMRRLTIAEAAAIQTFPEGYKFCGPKTKAYKQIGNAVPSKFAQAVAETVRDLYL